VTADDKASTQPDQRPRPGATPPRKRLLMVGVCVVVAVVVVVAAVMGRGEPDPQQSTAPRSQPVPPAAAVPLPRDLPQGPPGVSPGDRRAARRSARAFARDYLAFQRGERAPSAIRVATAQVRELIAALPRGRGTPAVRQHPARLAGIALRAGARPDTIVATATITRLGARFPFRFTLRKDTGRWRVVAVRLG
jgi:hypothetical protein